MSHPLISIVIPTYNHAHFLKRAINSVLSQTYVDWQLIIVNNYSEDDTIDVVEAFNDPRIQLINYPNHGVIAASRNEGIRHATGQYVAFLDSDDQWYANKLAVCAEALQAGFDVVCHSEYWVYEDGSKKQVNYGPESRAQYEKMLYRGNCLSTSATVVRKTLLDELSGFCTDSQFITAEDYELWLRLAKHGARFQFINDILGEYTIYHASASGNVLKHVAAVLAVIAAHHDRQESKFVNLFKYRQARARVIGGGALTLCRQGYVVKAWRQLVRAIVQWPFACRSYLFLLWILFSSLMQVVRIRS